jgi:hypothetical protein
VVGASAAMRVRRSSARCCSASTTARACSITSAPRPRDQPALTRIERRVEGGESCLEGGLSRAIARTVARATDCVSPQCLSH